MVWIGFPMIITGAMTDFVLVPGLDRKPPLLTA